jgi:hypothetical protein
LALALAAFEELQHGAGVDAEHPADEDDGKAAEADAAGGGAAEAAEVFDVVAAAAVFPVHIGLPVVGLVGGKAVDHAAEH